VQDLGDTRLDLYDPVRFIRTCSTDWSSPQDEPVAVHVTCSTQHLGESQA
jgi:D-lactate dehydrogenase